MNILKKLTIGLVLLVAGSTTFAETFTRDVVHDWDVAQFEGFSLNVDRGLVSVTGSDDSRFRLQIHFETHARDLERANQGFDRYSIEITEENKLQIHLKHKKPALSWLMFWRKSPSASVEISVPDGLDLDLVTGSGQIEIRNLDSKLRCVTGAGEVRVSDSTGSFKVVTGAGNLVIESFAGSLRASTGSGNVSAKGEISSFNVNTGAGDVTIDSSAIKLKESSISTGAGNIYVFLDPDAAFDLDAGVKLGGISCDFPLLNMRSEKKKLLGHTGEGAQRLSLNTGIGDVNVRQK